MAAIDIEFKDHLAIIELARPKANALNMDMVQELIEALSKLSSAEYIRGVILTGQGSIFSAGLDVIELYSYNEERIDRFWEAFQNLLKDLAVFPKPLVAAVNGHAPAGGCVLAMACDYRVMVDGNSRIGLNEVPFGVVVPTPVLELAAYTVGRRKAERMCLNGMLMPGLEAKEFGLVDDVFPAGDLMKWAETKLEVWLSFSESAWRKTKQKARRPLLAAIDVDMAEGYGDTIRGWWSPEARKQIAKMIEDLQAKK